MQQETLGAQAIEELGVGTPTTTLAFQCSSTCVVLILGSTGRDRGCQGNELCEEPAAVAVAAGPQQRQKQMQ